MFTFIVPVTDCSDIAINEVRAAVFAAGADPRRVSIEPNVYVEPYKTTSASFQIRLLAESYPARTIFFCMANFGKERPKRIIGETDRGGILFQGADNGAFSWLLEDFGCKDVYELPDPGFVPFGGKYVHPTTLARLTNGSSPSDLGRVELEPDTLVRHEIKAYELLHIDNFGNAKLNVHKSALPQSGKVDVSWPGGTLTAIVGRRMMEGNSGDWMLYPGSSLDLAELGQVRGDGFRSQPAVVGDIFRITPCES